MIKSNLELILKERNLEIEDLLSFGIPLHQLNAIKSNEIQNVRIKNIDKLCTQLNIRPEELFTYDPFYIKLDHINHFPQTDKLEFIFEIKEFGKTMHCLLYGNYIFNSDEKALNITTNFTEPGQYPEVKVKNDVFLKMLKELQKDFLIYLELEIMKIVLPLINIKSTCVKTFDFKFPKELSEHNNL